MQNKNGLYLVYVKDGMVYSVAQTKEEWTTLQMLGNAIGGNPVKVYDEPLGIATNLIEEG